MPGMPGTSEQMMGGGGGGRGRRRHRFGFGGNGNHHYWDGDADLVETVVDDENEDEEQGLGRPETGGNTTESEKRDLELVEEESMAEVPVPVRGKAGGYRFGSRKGTLRSLSWLARGGGDTFIWLDAMSVSPSY